MVVASYLEGRVRIRDEGLKKEPLVSRVRETLLAMPGVCGVEANPRVGSLLVLYSAASAAVDNIMRIISDILDSGKGLETTVESGRTSAKIAPGGRVSLSITPAMKRRLVNIGMLASLALSLAAAVFDVKKLHILAGIVFVALFGDHLFERRKMIFG